MARVCADLDLGIAPQRALAALAIRVPSERIEALTVAVLSQQRAGGDLAGLLRRHGRAAAQRQPGGAGGTIGDRPGADDRAASSSRCRC